MPLQATSGAASYDGFGGGVAVMPQYIEDVFSTWLYTGNGSTQTITNGIDLAGKGGLVWTKNRIQTYNHTLIDSANGVGYQLESNTTAALANGGSAVISSFNSDGFSVGSAGRINYSGDGIASWTFRKQPKFFDVVTYTGTGSATTIAHNLGSVPGCIMVKATSGAAQDWNVYHVSLGNTYRLLLNSTAQAYDVGNVCWNSTTPTSSVFSLGTNSGVNASGVTYVAYLFAHDAGGFGLTGTDNVISCGSLTADGSGNASVNLGYEPQWIMYKAASGPSGTGSWRVIDNMRGLVVQPAGSGLTTRLLANSANAEATDEDISPNATGFTGGYASFGASTTYIYIAIRRGPMKVPELGTSVFKPIARTGTGSDVIVTGVGFPPDLAIVKARDGREGEWFDRLRGKLTNLRIPGAYSEQVETNSLTGFDYMDGVSFGADSNAQANASGVPFSNLYFKRAPGFFDEVCYTGTGSATTFAHNLGVVPELMIIKSRSDTSGWRVYSAALGAGYLLQLSSTAAAFDDSPSYTTWNNTTPTSSVFSVGAASAVNGSGTNYVSYLFATCAGVSKVGSYTGTGTTQTINCGFTAGARFVLIKRTDSTGDWYVWDSARGIVAGNDPHLSLNTAAAEVTTDDSVDTDSTGFVVNQVAATNINVSSATYIFLAIA